MIWNIPSDVTSLKKDLGGAQSVPTASQNGEYLGPCPNYGSTNRTETHEYTFTIYAMPSTVDYGNAMNTMNTTLQARFAEDALSITTLTVTSDAASAN